MSRRVEVRTNCRLHFGLTSLGHDVECPQFGGVGVMVDAPGVHLQITSAEQFTTAGPLSERVTKFATSIAEHLQLAALPEVHVEVLAAPREHTGLGVGTQLGLAVAAGFAECLGFPWRDPLRLSQLTRRGRRSAIGTYGFLLGGLIVDAGHRTDEQLGQLAYRGEFPIDWRFALLAPHAKLGRAGAAEDRTIANLPPVPRAITEELEQITSTQFIPASKNNDFAIFSEALYRYGCLAGKCFAPAQGGIFSSPETARLIAWLRAQGIAGVGQSSWGPTVFALLPNAQAADDLNALLSDKSEFQDYEFVTAAAANQGATVAVSE